MVRSTYCIDYEKEWKLKDETALRSNDYDVDELISTIKFYQIIVIATASYICVGLNSNKVYCVMRDDLSTSMLKLS